jgi:hypothetical protein
LEEAFTAEDAEKGKKSTAADLPGREVFGYAGLKSRDDSAVPTGLAYSVRADPALKRRAELIACLAAGVRGNTEKCRSLDSPSTSLRVAREDKAFTAEDAEDAEDAEKTQGPSTRACGDRSG